MIRDMVGYGGNVPEFLWPNQARLAVNFVINYEEGAELTPVNGDAYCETYGGEFPLVAKARGRRHLSMESLFEYGSRCGIWRLLRLFEQQQIPLTLFATGYALTLNPLLCEYLRNSDYEIAGHAWRWIDHESMRKHKEKQHIEQCIKTIADCTGQIPAGWYTGRKSENTQAILAEIGGFLYNSDSYADDLPYLSNGQLIIPYTLDCNDFRYTTSPGFSNGQEFFVHLRDTFDYLYQENRLNLMTIALHSRISGRPGRTKAVERFITYIKQFPDVWICKRVEIAEFWHKQGAPDFRRAD